MGKDPGCARNGFGCTAKTGVAVKWGATEDTSVVTFFWDRCVVRGTYVCRRKEEKQELGQTKKKEKKEKKKSRACKSRNKKGGEKTRR